MPKHSAIDIVQPVTDIFQPTQKSNLPDSRLRGNDGM